MKLAIAEVKVVHSSDVLLSATLYELRSDERKYLILACARELPQKGRVEIDFQGRHAKRQ